VDISADEMDARIASRIEGGCRFLDGEGFKGLCVLNKVVRQCLADEKEVRGADVWQRQEGG
jgi:hypothetical protein